MKKTIIFLLISIPFWNSNLYSQLYLELAQDTSLTFDEIVEQTETYFDTKGRGKHTGYKQYKRWEYWTRRSLGPNDKIIPTAQAFSEIKKYRSSETTNKLSGNWTEMGPSSATNTSTWSSHIGRITSIGLDVNDSNHYIVGSPGGGVWKTTNDGSNWTPIFDNEVIINVYALAISPTNAQHYYCGTQGLGMLRSLDGGATWIATNGIGNSTLINRIIIDPNNSSTLLAINQYGNVYRSTDQGANWNSVLSPGSYLYDLEFKPNDSNIVYASSDGNIYKSTNNGASFSTLSGPWSNDPMMMAVTADDSEYLYVLQEDQGGFGALYLSTDSGASFTTQSDDSSGNNNIMGYNMNQSGGQAPRDMDVIVSPTDKTEVHVAGIMTFKSTNSGVSWNQTTHWVISNSLPFIHADCDIMFYEGNKIYFGTDGGIFISTDGANSVVDKTTGLGIRQFYRIGVSETEVDRVSGGSQDNGTGTVINGAWTDWVGADGMETFIAKHDEDIMYASIQYGSLYKTVNGGTSLTNISNTSGSGDWVTPLEEDPITNNVLYQGKAQLYKSSNGGSSWSTISSFNPSNSNDVNLVEVTVAPTNNDVIYAAYRHQIFKTNNGGSSWTDVSPNYAFSNVNYISVHPTDDQKALVVLSGTSAKVVETSDQGNTWTDITATLPSVGAECAIYEGSTEEGIYVSMNPGIYYKNNINTAWTTYMTDLPNVRVAELEIRNDFLYAASYGRGLWKNDLSSNSTCTVVGITDLGIDDCDNGTGLYNRVLQVTYVGAPSAGTLDVHGSSFSISGSPQVLVLVNQPLDGASVDVTAEFSDDSNCTLTVTNLYTNPSTCPCIIGNAGEQVLSCEGYNTGTISDDTFTFSLNPSGLINTGATYSINGDLTVANIAYGSPYILDNGGSGYPVSGGNLNLSLIDDGDPTCLLPVTIVAPTSCSDNYTCATANVISSLGIHAAIGPSQGNGGSNAGRHANWFTYTPPTNGLLTVHSCLMGIDTRLFIHDGDCNNLNQVTTSDDSCPIVSGSANNYASEIVDFCVSGGTTYYLEWDDRWDTAGFDFEVLFTTNTYYADSDGDGFGDSNTSISDCAAPVGYVTDNTDCDDNDANNYPGNTEVCDGADNDCDGSIDEGVGITYYADNDGDGYGDSSSSMTACSAPSGYTTNSTDCDDNDANNYPGNTEVCDGADNNCDGIVDEGCGSTNFCDDIYLVINTVSQSIYRAEINITSVANVTGSTPVLFTAGTDIDLNPPFEVALGTDFEARIEPCTPLPAPGGDPNFYGISSIEAFVDYFERPENRYKKIKLELITAEGKIKYSLSGNYEALKQLKKEVTKSDSNNLLLRVRFISY